MKLRGPSRGWLLLALTILLATPLGVYFGLHVRRQSAIAGIEQLGGRVVPTRGGPDWLRRLVGHRAMRIFDRATVVNLSGTDTSDADLSLLTRLDGVERLNLKGTAITDRGMATLSRLRELKALDLSGTAISDAGLAHVAELTALEYLYLSGTAVTDSGLAHLEGLSKLRHLSVEDTEVTADGVQKLRDRLPDLRDVSW